MTQGTANRVAFNTAAQTTLRVLIASYFLAVALQLIPGTDLGVLFASILPAPYAGATAAGLVFILSFMVMIGYATRAAALIIALMTFFASYLTMVELGVVQELGAFWRDLALIAALLLTYSEPAMGSRNPRRILHRQIAPRRVAPATPSQRRIKPLMRKSEDEDIRAHLRGTPRKAVKAAPLVDPAFIDNIFAEDGFHAS